jgi:hypothetical protein
MQTSGGLVKTCSTGCVREKTETSGTRKRLEATLQPLRHKHACFPFAPTAAEIRQHCTLQVAVVVLTEVSLNQPSFDKLPVRPVGGCSVFVN